MCYLALSTAGDTLALLASAATLDVDITPGPVGASTLGTQNVDVGSTAVDSSVDVVDGQTSDGDTAGGGSGRAAVLVVLLNDNTVVGDSGEGDILVGDAPDGTGGTVDTLDADTCRREGLETGIWEGRPGGMRTVHGVLDVAVLDGDTVDNVVSASTDGTDGDTVTASALSAGKVDVLERSVSKWSHEASPWKYIPSRS